MSATRAAKSTDINPLLECNRAVLSSTVSTPAPASAPPSEPGVAEPGVDEEHAITNAHTASNQKNRRNVVIDTCPSLSHFNRSPPSTQSECRPRTLSKLADPLERSDRRDLQMIVAIAADKSQLDCKMHQTQ